MRQTRFLLTACLLFTTVAQLAGAEILTNVTDQVSSLVEKVLDRPSESFAVTKKALRALQLYANYASIAYCDARGWDCGKRCNGPSRGTEFLDDVFDDATDTYAYIAANHRRRELIIAFRGSVTRSSWWQNIDLFKEPMPLPDDDKVEVHSGFLECFNKVDEALRAALQKAIDRFPQYKRTYVGHSLGGGLASIAAAKYHRITEELVRRRLVTFGAPPTGEKHFARSIERLLGSDNVTDSDLPGAIRVVNYDDIVPQMAPKFLGYVHFDRELWITDKDEDQHFVNVRWCAKHTENGDPGCSKNITGRVDYRRHGLYWGMLSGSPDQCRVPGPTTALDHGDTVAILDSGS